MIGFLDGTVAEISRGDNTTALVLAVGGVGYEVLMPSRAAEHLREGGSAKLHIYTHMRADGRGDSALELFGFERAWDKRAFLFLTSVSGVGFRTALGILSAVDPAVVIQAIVRQDRATLTSVPGVGKKTAERLIVELADKAPALLALRPRDTSSAAVDSTSVSAAVNAAMATFETESDVLWVQARQALLALGFKEVDAANAMRDYYKDAAGKDLTVTTFVRGALSKLRSI